MPILNHTNIKPLLRSAALSAGVVLTAGTIFSPKASLAQNFDVSENISQAPYKGQSAGTGVGQDGVSTDKGRTNVNFSDFGSYTPNTNPGSNGNPSDLLPINQQNTTVNGEHTTSYSASNVNNQIGAKSGTSYTQAPRLDPAQFGRAVNPFLAGQNPNNTSLPPTTTALQTTFTPGGYTEIPSGQYNFGFNNAGGVAGNSTIYTGIYRNTNLIPIGSGFLLAPPLPPASFGSVDLNQNIDPWTGKLK